MEKEIHCKNLNDIEKISKKLILEYPDERIFAFYGEMGSGKTTLIKGICGALGVSGIVTSPTFAIINEYSTSTDPVNHFDFYRIKNLYEAMDIGVEEYLYSGNYCFIEWPEKIEELLPPNYVYISIIEGNKEDSRIIKHKVM